MREMLSAAIIALIPGLFDIFSYRSYAGIYYNQSRELWDVCVEHARASNLPISDCSGIASAADAAFSSAHASMTPVVVALSVTIYFLAWWTLSARKELNELKQR